MPMWVVAGCRLPLAGGYQTWDLTDQGGEPICTSSVTLDSTSNPFWAGNGVPETDTPAGLVDATANCSLSDGLGPVEVASEVAST